MVLFSLLSNVVGGLKTAYEKSVQAKRNEARLLSISSALRELHQLTGHAFREATAAFGDNSDNKSNGNNSNEKSGDKNDGGNTDEAGGSDNNGRNGSDMPSELDASAEECIKVAGDTAAGAAREAAELFDAVAALQGSKFRKWWKSDEGRARLDSCTQLLSDARNRVIVLFQVISTARARRQEEHMLRLKSGTASGDPRGSHAGEAADLSDPEAFEEFRASPHAAAFRDMILALVSDYHAAGRDAEEVRRRESAIQSGHARAQQSLVASEFQAWRGSAAEDNKSGGVQGTGQLGTGQGTGNSAAKEVIGNELRPGAVAAPTTSEAPPRTNITGAKTSTDGEGKGKGKGKFPTAAGTSNRSGAPAGGDAKTGGTGDGEDTDAPAPVFGQRELRGIEERLQRQGRDLAPIMPPIASAARPATHPGGVSDPSATGAAATAGSEADSPAPGVTADEAAQLLAWVASEGADESTFPAQNVRAVAAALSQCASIDARDKANGSGSGPSGSRRDSHMDGVKQNATSFGAYATALVANGALASAVRVLSAAAETSYAAHASPSARATAIDVATATLALIEICVRGSHRRVSALAFCDGADAVLLAMRAFPLERSVVLPALRVLWSLSRDRGTAVRVLDGVSISASSSLASDTASSTSARPALIASRPITGPDAIASALAQFDRDDEVLQVACATLRRLGRWESDGAVDVIMRAGGALAISRFLDLAGDTEGDGDDQFAATTAAAVSGSRSASAAAAAASHAVGASTSSSTSTITLSSSSSSAAAWSPPQDTERLRPLTLAHGLSLLAMLSRTKGVSKHIVDVIGGGGALASLISHASRLSADSGARTVIFAVVRLVESLADGCGKLARDMFRAAGVHIALVRLLACDAIRGDIAATVTVLAIESLVSDAGATDLVHAGSAESLVRAAVLQVTAATDPASNNGNGVGNSSGSGFDSPVQNAKRPAAGGGSDPGLAVLFAGAMTPLLRRLVAAARVESRGPERVAMASRMLDEAARLTFLVRDLGPVRLTSTSDEVRERRKRKAMLRKGMRATLLTSSAVAAWGQGPARDTAKNNNSGNGGDAGSSPGSPTSANGAKMPELIPRLMPNGERAIASPGSPTAAGDRDRARDDDDADASSVASSTAASAFSVHDSSGNNNNNNNNRTSNFNADNDHDHELSPLTVSDAASAVLASVVRAVTEAVRDVSPVAPVELFARAASLLRRTDFASLDRQRILDAEAYGLQLFQRMRAVADEITLQEREIIGDHLAGLERASRVREAFVSRATEVHPSHDVAVQDSADTALFDTDAERIAAENALRATRPLLFAMVYGNAELFGATVKGKSREVEYTFAARLLTRLFDESEEVAALRESLRHRSEKARAAQDLRGQGLRASVISSRIAAMNAKFHQHGGGTTEAQRLVFELARLATPMPAELPKTVDTARALAGALAYALRADPTAHSPVLVVSAIGMLLGWNPLDPRLQRASAMSANSWWSAAPRVPDAYAAESLLGDLVTPLRLGQDPGDYVVRSAVLVAMVLERAPGGPSNSTLALYRKEYASCVREEVKTARRMEATLVRGVERYVPPDDVTIRMRAMRLLAGRTRVSPGVMEACRARGRWGKMGTTWRFLDPAITVAGLPKVCGSCDAPLRCCCSMFGVRGTTCPICNLHVCGKCIAKEARYFVPFSWREKRICRACRIIVNVNGGASIIPG